MAKAGEQAVLIVGSGGREHALAAALARSAHVSRIAFAGGPNAGLAQLAEPIDLDEAVRRAGEFDLAVIGPEAPLVAGVADDIRAAGTPVFGPSAQAAQLEASKAFTKEICAEAGVPTAAAIVCHSREEAHRALDGMGGLAVIKADGLAAGKGVVVAQTQDEARAAIDACFAGSFGAAGTTVLVEERLSGPEVSLFALCDGNTVRLLATARDYKRAHDGDMGPNTGGMGAVSPAPGFDLAEVEDAMARIVRPTIDALSRRGIRYVGVLYAGLMLTASGPKLIEYNVRFGDPECQAIMPRLTSDPFELLLAAATGRLADASIELTPESAVAVVVAASGYPGAIETGELIGGLDAVEAAGVEVYHAGTRPSAHGVLSNGGRVLAAVAMGTEPALARAKVYDALSMLDWPGGRMRSDIGL